MFTIQNMVSGILISDTDVGVATSTGSFFVKLEVSIKKVSNRNATSHMAVISTQVLFLLTFALGMFFTFWMDDKTMRGWLHTTVPG